MFNINFANDWIRTADSGIESNCSANWATTTAQQLELCFVIQFRMKQVLLLLSANAVVCFKLAKLERRRRRLRSCWCRWIGKQFLMKFFCLQNSFLIAVSPIRNFSYKLEGH